MRVNFPHLDIAKFIMALLVVEIHTRPFLDFDSALLNKVASGIDCVAVPFFFIASGYLCFRGVDMHLMGNPHSASSMRIRKTIKKLLILYFIWVVIYLPTTIFGVMTFADGNPIKNIAVLARNILLIGEGPYSYHLWYLHASVIGFALVYLMLRRGARWKVVLFLSAVLLIFGFAIDFVAGQGMGVFSTLADLYMKVFANVRNGVFEGFFYIALGMAFALTRIEGRFSYGVCALGCLAGLSGCIVVSPDAHLPFCALFAGSLFLLSVVRFGSDMPAHPFVRNLSTGVYLSHMLFAALLVYGICGGVDSTLVYNDISHMGLYFFSLVCSIALTAIAIVLSKRVRFVKTIFGF